MVFIDYFYVGRVVVGFVYFICVFECFLVIVFSLLIGVFFWFCFNVCGIVVYKMRKNIFLDKNVYLFLK